MKLEIELEKECNFQRNTHLGYMYLYRSSFLLYCIIAASFQNLSKIVDKLCLYTFQATFSAKLSGNCFLADSSTWKFYDQKSFMNAF